jgi:CO/xanthine dehydrogenase Mo-binding subunit
VLPVSHDEHALCRETVRFVGDPVAAVIARDEATAAEAVNLIEVDYAALRTYASPDDSLAHPEPRIHDYGDVATSTRRSRCSLAMLTPHHRRRPRVR